MTDTAVLYYSAGGKDGIALLDMLATHFPKVICIYMYLIRDMEHIQPYIRWAENRYKGICDVRVIQVESFQMDSIRKIGLFCDAEPDIKIRKVGEFEEEMRQKYGFHYAFSGMKGVDGYMKRMRLKMFAKTGYITEKGMVYPLAIWTNKEVLNYINSRNLIQPFVYMPECVSQGFSIDLPTLIHLRKFYPKDYQLTLQRFPYAEKLIYDYVKNNQDSTSLSKVRR